MDHQITELVKANSLDEHSFQKGVPLASKESNQRDRDDLILLFHSFIYGVDVRIWQGIIIFI